MSKYGTMRMGACLLEHAYRSVLTEWCNQKGGRHEYGSMLTGAIYFQTKIMTFDFFESAWNG